MKKSPALPGRIAGQYFTERARHLVWGTPRQSRLTKVIGLVSAGDRACVFLFHFRVDARHAHHHASI